MLNWRVLGFYLTLLVFLLTSGKPLWWLPLGSLALLVLSSPSKHFSVAPDWHHWHPIFASFDASPLTAFVSRWVRYKKIIGGDSLLLLSAQGEFGLLLLDLSKNDLETFLHFVWSKNLLARFCNRPKSQLLRLLEDVRKCSDRVDLSYLVGFLKPREAEWHSLGCFGIGWYRGGRKGQHRILPSLGRTLWRVRGDNINWVFTTDGIAEHIDKVIEDLCNGISPDELIQNLPRKDDLTIGWFAPKLKTLTVGEIAKLR